MNREEYISANGWLRCGTSAWLDPTDNGACGIDMAHQLQLDRDAAIRDHVDKHRPHSSEDAMAARIAERERAAVSHDGAGMVDLSAHPIDFGLLSGNPTPSSKLLGQPPDDAPPMPERGQDISVNRQLPWRKSHYYDIEDANAAPVARTHGLDDQAAVIHRVNNWDALYANVEHWKARAESAERRVAELQNMAELDEEALAAVERERDQLRAELGVGELPE